MPPAISSVFFKLDESCLRDDLNLKAFPIISPVHRSRNTEAKNVRLKVTTDLRGRGRAKRKLMLIKVSGSLFKF